MRRPIAKLWVGLAAILALLLLNYPAALADTPAPKLIISQIKITSSSGQFISIYNNSDASLDLSTVQLQYFNNYDLSKATSGKLISLAGTVMPRGYVIVSDGPVMMCYLAVVDSVSLGLSSTAGFVQVSHFASTSSPQISSILDDYIGWSKTAANGAQTLPTNTSAFLQRQPLDAQNRPSIFLPGSGSWQQVQPDSSNLCSLVTTGSPNIPAKSILGSQLLPGTEPPATFVEGSSTPDGPLTGPNYGMMTPVITELLPNPAEPQTDSEDEFIELYNPNDQAFDLSGFTLEVGTTTKHQYKFPSDSSMASKSFKSLYSVDTGLSLSNTSGQARLIDPNGNVISQTEVYSTAKDGQAWALANGKWYWTSKVTPDAANIIQLPNTLTVNKLSVGGSSTSAPKTSAKKSTGKVKGASTTKASTTNSNNFANTSAKSSSINMLILAGVGGLALLYALYEYRHDLANQIYRFQRYREARRDNR